MLCTENELCTWPSDSCITVLRMKGADYKCRKKEWNELKKLSIHGDGVRRGLNPSFVNLVSIEEKCNGDQFDVCAVPISPWEQDSVSSLSLSDEGWAIPHRSQSSTHLDLDCEMNFEPGKLVLKKSTSSPSLVEKNKSKSMETNDREDDELLDGRIDNANNCLHCQDRGTGYLKEGINSVNGDGEGDAQSNDSDMLTSTEIHDRNAYNQQPVTDEHNEELPSETSELLQEGDESMPSLTPVVLLIRSCFPFFFRTRVNLRN